MLIQSTRNYGIDKIKMCVYAPSGHGKTTLAKTTGAATAVASFEAGLMPLNESDVDYVDCTLDDDGNILSKVKRLERLQEFYKFLQTPQAKEKYKWIVLDSLTEIGSTIVEKYQAQFPDRKDSLPMWGEVGKELRSIVKQFRDLPMNVLFLCLSETEKDEMGARYQAISLPGKMSQTLPSYVDICAYYHVYEDENQNKIRGLVCQPNGKIVAKDRSGKLDTFMPPDILKIAERIRS